jgi:large subunit ribosomal protein L25
MARKELVVEVREVLGKRVARLRREGILPANIYGHGLESVSVQVNGEEFEHLMRTSTANEVIDVKVAGERAARPVVMHRVQRNPLTSGALHVDFYQVSLREKMRAAVPLMVTGQSEAVETYNGVLVHALDELSIEALPLDIPTHIEVDISVLAELESSVHVRDLVVPGNVTVLNEPDAVVVKVEAPRIALELEEEAAAAAEEAAEAAEAVAEEAGEEKAEASAESEEEHKADA